MNPAAVDAKPSDRLPRLTVSPAATTLILPSSGTWPVATIDLAGTWTGPTSSHANLQLAVVAPAELEVSCDGGAVYSNGCTYTNWAFLDFDQDGTGEMSQTVLVRPKPNTMPESAPWTVFFRNDGFAGGTQSVTIDAAYASLSGFSLKGYFPGKVELVHGGVATRELHVRAWVGKTVYNNYLLIEDDTRTLSPSGKVRIPLGTVSKQYFEWYTATEGSTSGRVVASIRSLNHTFVAETGSLSGTFSVTMPHADIGGTLVEQRWEYDLGRSWDLPNPRACSAGCEAGTTCESTLGWCFGGDPWVGTTGPEVNTVQHDTLGAWAGPAEAMLASARNDITLWLPNFYRETSTNIWQPDTSWTKATYAGLENLSAISDLGFKVCNEMFMGYLGDRGFGYNEEQLKNLFTGYTYPPGSICERIYTGSAIQLPALVKRDFSPCVGLSVSDHAGWRPTCESIYSATPSGLKPATYSNWLNSTAYCYRADEALYLVPGELNTTPLYLCRYKDAVFNLPSSPVAQAGVYACFNPSANAAGHLLDAGTREESVVAPTSGYPLCSNGELGRDFPLLTYRDQVDFNLAPRVGASDLFASCIWDLERMAPDLVPSSGPALETALHAAFPDSKCLSLPRISLMVSRFLDYDTLGAGYLHSLQKDWLRVHQFVLREGLEQSAGDMVVGSPSASSAIGLSSLLSLGRAGLAFAADERYRGFINSHAPILREPALDEPAHAAVGSADEDEHRYPLHVAIVETLTAQSKVLIAHAEQSEAATYEECVGGTRNRIDELLREVGNHNRLGLLMESIASNYYNTSATGNPSCSSDAECTSRGLQCDTAARLCRGTWHGRWLTAKSEYDAVQAQLSATLDRLRRCGNPLGIEEDDLPLYFGDVLGSNGRYFASSDYLLERWAIPAVSSASVALDMARNAWSSKFNEEIQVALRSDEQQRRLDAISSEFGREIADACGMSEPWEDILSSFNDERVPGNCFVKPSCLGTDRPEPQCFRGGIGESVLNMIGAGQDVEIARSALSDQFEQYDAELERCVKLQIDLTGDTRLRESHTLYMNDLTQQKASADLAAAQTRGVGGMFSAMIALPPNPFAAGAAMYGQSLERTSIKLGASMEQAQRSFETMMAKRLSDREIENCFLQAETLKIGIDTATLSIQRRMTDSILATQRLVDSIGRVRSLLDEGKATLERESNRTITNAAQHYWIDERMSRFRSEFTWAQRLTYLALRAVEYEYQQSIPLRKAVLGAQSPLELESVIRDLQREQATRTVNRKRPEMGSFVLSLRNDVLRVDDLRLRVAALSAAGHSGTVRNWSDTVVLRDRLMSRGYALHDADGRYLGQGIPFSLSEWGALRLRCGERLWRVTATVQGDFPGVAAPSVPLVLLKNNVFKSQWCDGYGAGTYQVASTHASGNLFRPAEAGADADPGSAWTGAMIRPWFNVRRSEFYAESYSLGSSEELAGRGLYGDYVLLFPYDGLLGPEGVGDGGRFPIEKLEDVLIRFDMLSVDDITY